MNSSPLYYTFIVFGVIMALIYYTKPKIMFDGDKIRSFGMSKDKTLIPLPVMALIIAVLTYSIFFYMYNDHGDEHRVDKTNMMGGMGNMNMVPQFIPQYSHIPHNTTQYAPMPTNQLNNLNTSYTYKLVRTAPDGTIIM